jgi:transcriptional regulator with XRE-family HTH domain
MGSVRLPPDQCERIVAGESPLKVWREFRGMAQTDLRRATAIRVDVIDKIERGVKKPTRAESLKFARALDVPAHGIDALSDSSRGCSALDLDEDEVPSRLPR